MTQLAQGLSVIIPVYNQDACLPDLVSRLLAFLPNIQPVFEIIPVDDASSDRSGAIIESFSNSYPQVRGIRLPVHSGKEAAIMIGLRAARYTSTVTLHANGSDDMGALTPMLVALADGADVCYGYDPKPVLHTPSDWFFVVAKRLMHLLRLFPNAHKTSRFRAFHTRLRERFDATDNPSIPLDTLLYRSTQHLHFMPIATQPPIAFSPSPHWSTQFMDLTNLMTSHSLKPIRLLWALSAICMVAGLTLAILNNNGPWWVIGVLSFLTGIVLFAVSIVGEYAARHYLLALYKNTPPPAQEAGKAK